jgi:hypothetical protein
MPFSSLSSRAQLTVLILVNAAGLAGDTIFWIRFVRKMKGFDWFVSQALYPVSAALFLSPVILGLHLTGRLNPPPPPPPLPPPPSSLLSSSSSSFPKRFPRRYMLVLAVMGCAANWGLTIGATLLPETLVTVMLRLTTVFTILQTMVIIGTKYRWTHGVGAVLVAAAAILDVVLGSGAAKAAAGISNSSNSSVDSSVAPPPSAGSWVGGIILILAICALPKGVYTEKWTKTHEIHPAFLRGMIATMTVALGLLLSPLAFVQTSPTQLPVPFTGKGIKEYLGAACGCFAGYPQPRTHPDADCDGAWVVYMAFIACNLTYDVTSIAIGKRGSAAIGAVGSSLSLVITIVLTQAPWLTGLTEPAPINVATGISVAMIVAGLVLYSTQKELPRSMYATDVTGCRDDEEDEEDEEDEVAYHSGSGTRGGKGASFRGRLVNRVGGDGEEGRGGMLTDVLLMGDGGRGGSG